MATSRRERDRAWAALSANLLMPGSGSLLLGRRRVGSVQTALALLGLVLSLAWIAVVTQRWLAEGADGLFPIPHLGLVVLGQALFVVSWVWALATAWNAVRRARR
jgi:hypothetical protein